MAGLPSPLSRAQGRDTGLRAPLYHQVYVALRGWIADGAYAPGARIPTEPELCRAFRVSRITVRRAIDELVRQGALVRRQGSGTFVREQGPEAASATDPREVARRVAGLGASTGVRDLRVEWVNADAETRAALELEEPARVHRSTRLRTRAGEPIGQVTVWLPEDVGRGVTRAALRRSTALEAIERTGHLAAAVDERIGAELAGLEAAARLGVPAGAPLVRVSRVVRDAAGRPIERVLALWRADAYEHRIAARRGRIDRHGWLAE
jgi:GntR family transcriptional regulator